MFRVSISDTSIVDVMISDASIVDVMILDDDSIVDVMMFDDDSIVGTSIVDAFIAIFDGGGVFRQIWRRMQPAVSCLARLRRVINVSRTYSDGYQERAPWFNATSIQPTAMEIF